MNDDDQRIGRNVAAIRGDMAQQAVADAMRERGHKWSQATVWSVEKGERPLRLAEASDLAELLDVTPGHFLAEEVEQLRQLSAAVRDFGAAESRLHEAMGSYEGARLVAMYWATQATELLDNESLTRRTRLELEQLALAVAESPDLSGQLEAYFARESEDDAETIYAIRDDDGEIRQTAHVRGNRG